MGWWQRAPAYSLTIYWTSAGGQPECQEILGTAIGWEILGNEQEPLGPQHYHGCLDFLTFIFQISNECMVPNSTSCMVPNSTMHLLAQTVKNLPAMQATWVWSLGSKDLLEKRMVTHSNILAWKIPWTGAWWATGHGVAKSRTWLTGRARTHTHR